LTRLADLKVLEKEMNRMTSADEYPRFSVGFYLQSIKTLVIRPSLFFQDLPLNEGLGRPFLFLLTSSLMSAAFILTLGMEQPFLTAAAQIINALGMPLITSAIGYPAAVAFRTRKPQMGYPRVFGVYAYSYGLFALVAWMPSFLWFAEITKWFFIGLGLVHACHFTKSRAAVTVLVSFGGSLVLFQFLVSVLTKV
jgi:hypothetical protein